MFDKIEDSSKLTGWRGFYAKYERFFIPVALIIGLLPDIFFFALVSFEVNIFFFVLYLVLAGLSIVTINLYEDGLVRGKFFLHLRLFAPLVIQFTFGALFSAFVLYYSFSGSLLTSWPFILVLVFLVIANEVFRKYNGRPDIQLGVFFLALFSFFNLAIPYFIRSLGPIVFIGSGIVSLVIAGLFIWLLFIYVPRVREVSNSVIGIILSIFIVMHVFYFTNLIPPIPLVARAIGIYYHVERVGNEYNLVGRKVNGFEDFLKRLSLFPEKFPVYQTSEAYAFSSVFAPPGMNLEIVHEWQFHDPKIGWMTRSAIPFPITGGRIEGFRGFSHISQVVPGRWRVNVKTAQGQIIGRYRFVVVEANEPPQYIFETR